MIPPARRLRVAGSHHHALSDCPLLGRGVNAGDGKMPPLSQPLSSPGARPPQPLVRRHNVKGYRRGPPPVPHLAVCSPQRTQRSQRYRDGLGPLWSFRMNQTRRIKNRAGLSGHGRMVGRRVKKSPAEAGLFFCRAASSVQNLCCRPRARTLNSESSSLLAATSPSASFML